MEKDSTKFPMFFVIMLIAISIFMTVGVFFDVEYVGVLFFVSLLLVIVFSILDKIYGLRFANHDDYYLFADVVCLIAVTALVHYKSNDFSRVLHILLIVLFVSIFLNICFDVFLSRDKYFVKIECIMLDIFQSISMIFIMCYFCNVKEFLFCVISICCEVTKIILKNIFYFKMRSFLNKNSLKEQTELQNSKSLNSNSNAKDDKGGL